ncbi:MAG: hypothetical protein JWM98_2732 [Thermoleophilia bacterium]|nr:hypothetical protein [Thermoleophilia bacterium]
MCSSAHPARMNLRTHLRVSTVPFLIVTVSVIALIAVLWVPSVKPLLKAQIPMLPMLVMGTSMLLTFAFSAWYVLSYAQVRRNVLTVRSITSKHRVDLKRLDVAEVIPKARSGSGRKKFELILRLEDEQGRQVFLPLNNWRDEDLLMARVLRATVDRKVRIEGDPMLVRRFSGLLDTYKSWDRQQAAA